MAQLLGRSVAIIVDDVTVTGLRCTFKVHKSNSKKPNSCAATITNLAGSRGLMKSKGAQVRVLAGYGGAVQQIFSGQARRIDHLHNRPDWVTQIECGDGEEAFLYSRINESFKAGTSWKDVFRRAAGVFATDTGNLEEKIANTSDVFLHGYSAQGRAAAEIDRLLKGKNLDWSIQDGRLQLLGPGEANADSLTTLNARSGMIGSPEYGTPTKKGGPEFLKVRTLLQPQLRPGSRIQVESRSITGLFVVQEVQHDGDTAGSNWFTDIEALPLAR